VIRHRRWYPSTKEKMAAIRLKATIRRPACRTPAIGRLQSTALAQNSSAIQIKGWR